MDFPDDKLVAIGINDGFCLASFIRDSCHWAFAQVGSLLKMTASTLIPLLRPFPFPAADDLQKQRIRAIAEDLDAHRKRVLAEHSHLTLTGLYNVLEKLRAGTAPDP